MKHYIVAVTGASGSVYGKRTIEVLVANGYMVDVIFSEMAKSIFEYELGISTDTFLNGLPKEQVKVFDVNNLFAPPASGSYYHDGMVIVPCSVGTLGHIASGSTDNLIHRAADVTLKEERRLVIVLRETPLNRIHIENALKMVDAGATILPATPAFYQKPQTISDIVDFTVAKALNTLIGKDIGMFKAWGES